MFTSSRYKQVLMRLVLKAVMAVDSIDSEVAVSSLCFCEVTAAAAGGGASVFVLLFCRRLGGITVCESDSSCRIQL